MGQELDIIRYKNDTFPISGNVDVDGNAVDLTGWNIYMYYDEKDPDTGAIKNVRIEGNVSDATRGIVAFIPRRRYTFDITDPNNPIEYQPLAVPGLFDYAVVRARISYEVATNGDYVEENGSYVLYDPNNANHTGLVRYNKINEKYTHKVGKLIIEDRVGE